LRKKKGALGLPWSGDGTVCDADADRVVQRLRQRRRQKRLTNKAQLSVSAERASETKERSRNKQYSTKSSNTRVYALIDNRMVKRCYDALRCDGAGVCVCDGGKPMVDGGLMMDDGDGDGDGDRDGMVAGRWEGTGLRAESKWCARGEQARLVHAAKRQLATGG
jgi:hypothetical protein